MATQDGSLGELGQVTASATHSDKPFMRVKCMDDVTLHVPHCVYTAVSYLSYHYELSPACEDEIELFDVPSTTLKHIVAFYTHNAGEPIADGAMYGTGYAFERAYADDWDGTQLERTVIKALPRTLNLKKWGLPAWCVEWLDTLDTPTLFQVQSVAEVLGADCVYYATLAKIAATLVTIMRSAPRTADIKTYWDTSDAPDGAHYALYEYLGPPGDIDVELYTDTSFPVRHGLVSPPNAEYTSTDFMKQYDALTDRAHQDLVCAI